MEFKDWSPKTGDPGLLCWDGEVSVDEVADTGDWGGAARSCIVRGRWFATQTGQQIVSLNNLLPETCIFIAPIPAHLHHHFRSEDDTRRELIERVSKAVLGEVSLDTLRAVAAALEGGK